jgi:hypothetical protein
MTVSLKIVRIKRYASYADRTNHPDWKNPDHLSDQELAEMGALVGMNRIVFRKQIDAMVKRGGEMLVAYQEEGDASRVVGLMAYDFVSTLQGQMCLVTDMPLASGAKPATHGAMREALQRFVSEGEATEIQMLERPRSVRRSGISEISRADRMDGPYPPPAEDADTEDGPPTQKLGIAGGRTRS